MNLFVPLILSFGVSISKFSSAKVCAAIRDCSNETERLTN